MFEPKNIKDPYKFIDDLYTRLNGALSDIKKTLSRMDCYPEKYCADMREESVLRSIINWINEYKD